MTSAEYCAALYLTAGSGRMVLSILKEESRSPEHHEIPIDRNTTRRISKASNPFQLAAMGGIPVSDAGVDIAELIRQTGSGVPDSG